MLKRERNTCLSMKKKLKIEEKIIIEENNEESSVTEEISQKTEEAKAPQKKAERRQHSKACCGGATSSGMRESGRKLVYHHLLRLWNLSPALNDAEAWRRWRKLRHVESWKQYRLLHRRKYILYTICLWRDISVVYVWSISSIIIEEEKYLRNLMKRKSMWRERKTRKRKHEREGCLVLFSQRKSAMREKCLLCLLSEISEMQNGYLWLYEEEERSLSSREEKEATVIWREKLKSAYYLRSSLERSSVWKSQAEEKRRIRESSEKRRSWENMKIACRETMRLQELKAGS